MSFIGIITNPKNEEYMTKKLSKNFLKQNIIFITDKNIEYMKNIRFETVMIDIQIKDIKNLKIIVSNAKYVILNEDLEIDLDVLENLNLVVISYGFNSKATFTVSSVSENSIIICLQRIIRNIFYEKYEPQEFEVEIDQNVDTHAVICIYILLLIYQRI